MDPQQWLEAATLAFNLIGMVVCLVVCWVVCVRVRAGGGMGCSAICRRSQSVSPVGQSTRGSGGSEGTRG